MKDYEGGQWKVCMRLRGSMQPSKSKNNTVVVTACEKEVYFGVKVIDLNGVDNAKTYWLL